MQTFGGVGRFVAISISLLLIVSGITELAISRTVCSDPGECVTSANWQSWSTAVPGVLLVVAGLALLAVAVVSLLRRSPHPDGHLTHS